MSRQGASQQPGEGFAREGFARGRFAQWLSILDTYDVRFLILNRERDEGLVQLVRSDPKWTVDLVDGDSILFSRAQALGRSPIAA